MAFADSAPVSPITPVEPVDPIRPPPPHTTHDGKFEATSRSASSESTSLVYSMLPETNRTHPEDRVIINLHFDGASRGNPGEAAVGGVISLKFCKLEWPVFGLPVEYGAYIGYHTNNSAEYMAVLYGVYKILKNVLPLIRNALEYKPIELHIYGDSELVIKQLRGEYKVRNPTLESYHKCLMSLFKNFDVVRAFHIMRSKNSAADALANRALDDTTDRKVLMVTMDMTGVTFGFLDRVDGEGGAAAVAAAAAAATTTATTATHDSETADLEVVTEMSHDGVANNRRVTQMRRVQDEGLALFRRKNADYGDAFADYGPVGVIVRMGDKIRRLASIHSKGVTLVNDESLRDTLIDLHNYAAMAVMLIDEKKED
jgi:ribonuclease HI